MIQAIETSYKGYRFRSRLEARWAVFFDALGWQWEYEKEGYDLGADGKYLPDFWIPMWQGFESSQSSNIGVFIEVKPVMATASEYLKACSLAKLSGQNVFIFQGSPYPGEYHITQIQTWDLGTVSPPIILHDLVFKKIREHFKVEGFPSHDSVTEMIRLANKTDSAGGFPPYAFYIKHNELDAAYTAARSARFEHGETPRISAGPAFDLRKPVNSRFNKS